MNTKLDWLKKYYTHFGIASLIVYFVLMLITIFKEYSGIFDIIVGVFTLISLFLILFYRPKNLSEKQFLVGLFLVVLSGTFIRFLLACFYYGNYDMHSYEIVRGIVASGGNVYASTTRYNYTPVWFNILWILGTINTYIPIAAFHFILRAFLTLVDLASLLILLLIVELDKGINRRDDLLLCAILFYLNPVSYLITGYHGQFENLAILFSLIGLYLYTYSAKVKKISGLIPWALFTFSMIVKHSVVAELLIYLNNSYKKNQDIVILFCLSIFLFLATFLPYWQQGSSGILMNVFGYKSIEGIYGITSIINLSIFRDLFVPGLVIYPFFIQKKEIKTQMLLAMLFFLVFTSGIGIQYFVLPIAFAALIPTAGFYLYTYIASVFILSDPNNIAFFPRIIPINLLWIVLIIWFAGIHFTRNQPLKI